MGKRKKSDVMKWEMGKGKWENCGAGGPFK
jgi:hypothetical protein